MAAAMAALEAAGPGAPFSLVGLGKLERRKSMVGLSLFSGDCVETLVSVDNERRD